MIFQPKNNRDIILSTILFSISFAPSPFGFLIYIAFIPVIRIALRVEPGFAFVCGYIIGLLINMIMLHWIAIYNPWYYSVFIPINALQIAVFMWLISLLARRNRIGAILISPFLWTSLEYIRELGPFAFTWLNVGYTQSKFLYLIQFAEYTGTIGITFWIVLINMIFILLWDSRYSRPRLLLFSSIIFLLFLFPLIHGMYILSKKEIKPGIVAAYVQPDISGMQKWDDSFREKNLFVLLSESQKLWGYSPDLIVWPETALPYYYKDYPHLHEILKQWIQENNTAILTGTLDKEETSKYNAAILIDNEKNDEPHLYHKIRPVPFAEKSVWTGVQDTTSVEPGNEYTLFKTRIYEKILIRDNHDWVISSNTKTRKEIKCAALICFESAFPSLARRMTADGADILTILTNDESFGYSAQPFQHLQIARMRAIENRRSIIHCANTGISAFIDPFGTVLKQSSLYKKEHSVQLLPVLTNMTFYTQFGSWISVIYPAVTIFIVLIIIFRLPENRSV